MSWVRRFEANGPVLGLLAWIAVTAGWWALAFAPLPLPASTLASVRAVCFGTLPNGLPDAWGWGVLIVSPLSMLGILLVVWGSQVRSGLQDWLARPALRVLLLVVAAGWLSGMAWVGNRVVVATAGVDRFDAASSSERLPEYYPRQERVLAPLQLVDQHGEAFSLDRLRGNVSVLTFAYAHCATVCPVLAQRARTVGESLGDEAPQVVVITLDPWRDTPARLPSVHRDWKLDTIPGSLVLSGSVEQVVEATEVFEMPFERDPNTGEIAHPMLMYVLDQQARLAYVFNNPSVEWLEDAVRRVRAVPAMPGQG